jgi:hypothetical protein
MRNVTLPSLAAPAGTIGRDSVNSNTGVGAVGDSSHPHSEMVRATVQKKERCPGISG